MTETQIYFQKEYRRANDILVNMMVGDRYFITLDSNWSGDIIYRGTDNDGLYFYFSKSAEGRKVKLQSLHLISATKTRE